jgi:hypothetical protein
MVGSLFWHVRDRIIRTTGAITRGTPHRNDPTIPLQFTGPPAAARGAAGPSMPLRTR